jgi:hypothetical protein
MVYRNILKRIIRRDSTTAVKEEGGGGLAGARSALTVKYCGTEDGKVDVPWPIEVFNEIVDHFQ